MEGTAVFPSTLANRSSPEGIQLAQRGSGSSEATPRAWGKHDKGQCYQKPGVITGVIAAFWFIVDTAVPSEQSLVYFSLLKAMYIHIQTLMSLDMPFYYQHTNRPAVGW